MTAISEITGFPVQERLHPGLMGDGVEFRDCKIKGGAFSRFGLDPDVAPMVPDDPLNNVQTQPRSLELIIPVQSLEHLENLFMILRIDPDPIVLDVKFIG